MEHQLRQHDQNIVIIVICCHIVIEIHRVSYDIVMSLIYLTYLTPSWTLLVT